MKHESGGGDMLIRLLHKTQKSQLQKVVYGIACFDNHLVAGFGNFYNGRSMERTIFLRIKHHAFPNNTQLHFNCKTKQIAVVSVVSAGYNIGNQIHKITFGDPR